MLQHDRGLSRFCMVKQAPMAGLGQPARSVGFIAVCVQVFKCLPNMIDISTLPATRIQRVWTPASALHWWRPTGL